MALDFKEKNFNIFKTFSHFPMCVLKYLVLKEKKKKT